MSSSAPSGSGATTGVGAVTVIGHLCLRKVMISTSMTSIMLRVKVDRADPALLHDQVAADIRRAIADGEALPGERLPPARDLAAVLGVNPNTVLRALRLLRDEGLLEFRRGRGTHVAGGAVAKSLVLGKAQELIDSHDERGIAKTNC